MAGAQHPHHLLDAEAEPQFWEVSFAFEIWTTSSFDEASLALLEKAKAHTRKYSIDWKAGKAVRAYAQGLSSPRIRKIFDDHYFNHPLTKIERALKQKSTEKAEPAVPVQPDEPKQIPVPSYVEHL